VRSITQAICIVLVFIATGCSLTPLDVSDQSRRFPERVPPVQRYQFVTPALSTTTGLAFGPAVENEIRNVMGPAIAPDARHALYITDLDVKDRKHKDRLIISILMKVHVQDEPGSETRPRFRVDVDIEVAFERDADLKKAREAAIKIAARALAKQLP